MNELKRISFDLDLNQADSEWGIVNADSKRVVEFIRYYFQNDINDSYYDYMNLVFDSMNDALLENKIDKASREMFEKFIIDIKPKEQLHSGGEGFSYWTSIDEENQEFPVVKILAHYK